jgi:Tol biopolymer transport system component
MFVNVESDALCAGDGPPTNFCLLATHRARNVHRARPAKGRSPFLQRLSLIRLHAGFLLVAVVAMGLNPAAAAADSGGQTRLVSVSSRGVQGNDLSGAPVISSEGRYLAFVSLASNLVPDDTNGSADVFIRDLSRGSTHRVSVSSSGAQANGASDSAAISTTGRYVAFVSTSSNLSPGQHIGASAVFVRDLRAGTTELVSVSRDGEQVDSSLSLHPSISADGRYVAFESDASNLVPGDTNNASDVFVRDRLHETTSRVSVSRTDRQAKGFSLEPVISANGRFVAYYSSARNLVPGPSNGFWGVFVRDMVIGVTSRVSISSAGALGSGGQPAISATGRYVAFAGWMPGDSPPTNGVNAIYVRDRLLGTTTRASVSSDGSPANGTSNFAAISADGRHVGFISDGSNLVPGDTNLTMDVFVRDMSNRTTSRANVSSGGAQAVLENTSGPPSITADGRLVAFASLAANLVPIDTNGVLADVFIRSRCGTTTGPDCH